jgi:hypothetical protein
MTNSNCDHEHTDAVIFAATWLAGDPQERVCRPIIPILKQRFGLTAHQAVEAMREADRIRKQGDAHATP